MENLNNKLIDQEFKMNGVSDNIETVFKAEAPYMETKEPFFGFVGVLLRDKEKDKVQCHLCGEWFDFLSGHVRLTHKMKVIKYRKQFGLPLHFPLCSKSFSEKSREGLLKLIENNKKPSGVLTPEQKERRLKWLRTKKAFLNHAYAYKSDAYANRHASCFAQLKSRFLTVSDMVGHEPSKTDIEEHDKSLYSQIYRRYGCLNLFRKKIGIETVEKHDEVSDEQIFSAFRSFAQKHNRTPRTTDFAKGTPNAKTIFRRFGSWGRALAQAGLTE